MRAREVSLFTGFVPSHRNIGYNVFDFFVKFRQISFVENAPLQIRFQREKKKIDFRDARDSDRGSRGTSPISTLAANRRTIKVTYRALALNYALGGLFLFATRRDAPRIRRSVVGATTWKSKRSAYAPLGLYIRGVSSDNRRASVFNRGLFADQFSVVEDVAREVVTSRILKSACLCTMRLKKLKFR